MIIDCRHFVLASGPLHVPNVPNIKGLKRFKGKVMHSAEGTMAMIWWAGGIHRHRWQRHSVLPGNRPLGRSCPCSRAACGFFGMNAVTGAFSSGCSSFPALANCTGAAVLEQ